MATQKHFAMDANGLTREVIERNVPSVYAPAPHDSRSSRYTLIPTGDVLSHLALAGFVPTQVMQGKTRFEGREAFTKHMIRLRQRADLGFSKPDVFEVVLVNSHDGSCSYVLYAGVFRMVCSNGLIVGDIKDALRVHHKGDIVGQVVEGSVKIVEESEGVLETLEQMKAIDLPADERHLFGEFAIRARFNVDEGDEANGIPNTRALVPYQADDFLRPRRYDDRKTDLYHTLQTVQENAMKGGIRRYVRADRKNHMTKAIHGIDQTVGLNKLLWQFSQELLKLHS